MGFWERTWGSKERKRGRERFKEMERGKALNGRRGTVGSGISGEPESDGEVTGLGLGEERRRSLEASTNYVRGTVTARTGDKGCFLGRRRKIFTETALRGDPKKKRSKLQA